MTGPQRAKSLVSSSPEGIGSSRRSSSSANLFSISQCFCPCRSVSGSQPTTVHLDPFAEAAGFLIADFAQCQEPMAAEGTLSSCPTLHPHLLCLCPPGGFNRGKVKGGQLGLASFTHCSSWWKISTGDSVLPEGFTSAPGWDLQPRILPHCCAHRKQHGPCSSHK